MVNPYDIEGVAEAIVQGLDMPLGERKERWNAMMTTLRRNDADCLAPALCRGAGRGAARRRLMPAAATRRRGGTTWLVGDIGATNARFGLVAPDGALPAFEHLRLRRFRDNRRRDRGLSRTARRPADAAASARWRSRRRSPATDPHDQSSLELLGPALRDRLGFERLDRDQRFHRASRWPCRCWPRPTGCRSAAARRSRGGPIAVLGPGSGLGASGLVPRPADPAGSRWPARAGMRRWRRRTIARAPCSI